MVLWLFVTEMGPIKKISLVAGLATLGKSCNLHKSKMAATDRTTELSFQSVNI